MRIVLVLLAMVACEDTAVRKLDLDKIVVTPDAKLRTDTVGEGQFAQRASFVLVDAENTANEGAVVSLGGQLTDDHGAMIGELKPQSLYVPAGEMRTFALVDAGQTPRPDARAAHIVVRTATIPTYPPPAHVDQIREIEDNGKLVVQGVLHNDSDKRGEIEVIASFHASDRTPLTRPFTLLHLQAHEQQTVQFVSGSGASRGTIFVGDVSY
ncbi:MAG TPA: hypothetical protein VGG28_19665 [Kofleriaceae bacterium]